MNDIVIPHWDAHPHLPWKDKVAYLAYEFSKLPQAPTPVEHTVGHGMYVRRMRIPAGTLFIGRAHRKGHECCLAKGSIILITSERKRRIDATTHVHTMPGFHMVLYALTDVVGETTHYNPTNSHDFEAMENDAFEPAETLIALGRSIAGRVRYHTMLKDHGLTDAQFQSAVMDTADQIPFPGGASKCVVERSDIHGLGLKAANSIEPGELIAPARVDGKRTPAGRYANHAFEPNARMVNRDSTTIVLCALKRIEAGEEITVDYRDALKVAQESACLA